MVQALINIGDYEDRMLTMIRGQFGLKNKSETINFLIRKFGEEQYEPKIRPEFAEKLLRIGREGIYYAYDSVEDAKRDVEQGVRHRAKDVAKAGEIGKKRSGSSPSSMVKDR